MKRQEINKVRHIQMSLVWTLGESVGSNWDVKVVTFAKKPIDSLREANLRLAEIGTVQRRAGCWKRTEACGQKGFQFQQNAAERQHSKACSTGASEVGWQGRQTVALPTKPIPNLVVGAALVESGSNEQTISVACAA